MGKGDHGGGREQDVHAAGQREVAFPEAKRLAGLMDRHQRRTTRRVDRDRRALQPQPVTDAAGARGGRRADRLVGVDLGGTQLLVHQPHVVVGALTHEHAGLGVRQGRRRGPGVLHRPPGRLQQQAVLRVDQHGLALGQSEERGVEAGHVVDESRSAGDDLAGGIRVGVVELRGVPPVGGYLRDGVAPLPQHVPVLVGVGGTREAQGVADDRERLGRRRAAVDARFVA